MTTNNPPAPQPAPAASRLEMSPEEMRALGYKAVDLLVAHFADIGARKPVANATRQQMDALLMEAIPEQASSVNGVLDHVMTNVFPNCDLIPHPRFFSFCPSPSNYVSAVADFLATGFNVFSGGWITSPAAAEIEIVTVNWLLELFGFPIKQGGGLFTSGGSMANLTGLAVARARKLGGHDPKARLYMSDQAHSSNIRAAKILGFAPEQISIVGSDGRFRLKADELADMIEADKENGLRPFCVMATAGTTNTGSVDPLPAIADLCDRHDLWLHVDGAYGAAAILTKSGAAQLSGIDRAHSITVDPHKWLFQPYEIGCILMRDHGWLKSTFAERPEYLRDTHGSAEEINFFDLGVQLTRRFNALKLYMSIKTFGLSAFRQAVQVGIDMAEATEAALRARPDWQIVSPATLAVINFRYVPQDHSLTAAQLDKLNEALSQRLIGSGDAMLATTLLRGKVVLRMCLVNPRISFATDVIATLDQLERYAADYLAASVAP